MRLIDVDALGVGRCSRELLTADYCAGWNGLIGMIENAPTIDAVEVVRCRDCKHRKKWKDEITWHCGNPEYGMATAVELQDDDFCSYGERRSHHDSLCDQEEAEA